MFVRRDLLRSKYRLLDYEAAEEYSWFCRHYSHSNCRLTALGQLSGERGEEDISRLDIFLFLQEKEPVLLVWNKLY